MKAFSFDNTWKCPSFKEAVLGIISSDRRMSNYKTSYQVTSKYFLMRICIYQYFFTAYARSRPLHRLGAAGGVP